MRIHSFAAEYRIATRLALEAGHSIARATEATSGSVPSSAVLAACRTACTTIVNGIRREFPADAILTASTLGDSERLANDRVWIIDPLDSAVEAITGGRDFAVAIGLSVASTPAVGVIYFPRRGLMYGAAWSAGAWVEENGVTRPLQANAATAGPLRLLIPSRTAGPTLDLIRQDLANTAAIPCELVGLACSMLIEGEADLYINPSPTLHDWHCCAPDLILREAGVTVTDCYGEPLSYNRRVPVQRQGLICCGAGMLDSLLPSVSPRFAAAHAPKAAGPGDGHTATKHFIDVPSPPISAVGWDT